MSPEGVIDRARQAAYDLAFMNPRTTDKELIDAALVVLLEHLLTLRVHAPGSDVGELVDVIPALDLRRLLEEVQG